MAGEGGLSPTADHLAAIVAAHLPAARCLVALSGGADSAVLAWAVSRTDRQARAVSIDHGLPGSSDLMGAAVAIADELGLEHSIIQVHAASDSETDLRTSRLAALEEAALATEVILTGHTRDDQAETVLGNVLRGAGTAGLAGIPRRRECWARPMLDLGRTEVRAVATELGLPYVDDPQNDDPTIRRNRIRSVTIPGLAQDHNPGLVAALARLGDVAAADDAVLEGRAVAVPLRVVDGGVLIPAASLQMLPPAVAARVARRALRLVSGPHAGLSADIAAVLAATLGERATIGGGFDVQREGPWVAITATSVAVPEPTQLTPGDGVDWGEWRLDADSGHVPVGRFGAELSAIGPLTVRAPMRGDRIAIDGGSKSVADALAEAAVPRRERSRWPLVESDGTILWIAGVRAAPAGKGRIVTVRAARRRS